MLRLLTLLLALAFLPLQASAQLELPDRPRAPERPAQRGGRPDAQRPRVPERSPEPAESAPAERRADELARELAALVDHADPQAEQLAGELLAEEEGGRVALLELLAGDRPVALVAAAQALLSQERPENFPIVAARLRERLPVRAIVPLLDVVRRADPIRGGPPLLVALLDHPQSVMRNAASAGLQAQSAPEILPHLVAVLASRRSETRQEALSIAAEIDDPSVLHLLTDRLGDTSSRVAAEAVRLLAVSPDARTDDRLMELAWTRHAMAANEHRRAAYALLALVAREELSGEPLLDDSHAPRLLELLRDVHPARKGAAAIALAGVGFRSEHPDETSWLDLEVPHELVKIASGAEFHSDFSSLQGPATRRLARISGVSFGSDGPAWQSWWARAAGTFRARRAVLRATPEDAASLHLVVRDPLADESALQGFQLLGPDASPAAGAPYPLYLTDLEARDLLSAARREGVLSAARLPGHRGAGQRDDGGAGERTLSITVAGQSKEFDFNAAAPSEPWFESLVGFAQALAKRNGWQRYVNPDRYRSQREYWLAERDWWAAEHSEVERGRRGVERVLACWASADEAVRTGGLELLEEVYAIPAARDAADFRWFLTCLTPDLPVEEARRFVSLALASAGAGDGDRTVLGQEVLQAVLDAYGSREPELTRFVLEETPGEVARAASADPRDFVRAVAAAVLVYASDDDSRDRFRALFDDPSAAVQVAAARAAGEVGDERWRAIILERARDGELEVRASALRAAGHLGGADAREILVDSLTSPAPAVRLAAADGLADLSDPINAPLLISLLAEGPDSPFFAPARRGLLGLGEAAWPDLLRTVHAGRGPVRREAAYLLSEQSVPAIASTLLGWLTDDPDDAGLAQELAVLTCIDMRSSSDPASAWWEWWDLVVHDDSVAWLKAGLERARIASPGVEEFRTPISERAARSLVAALEGPDALLAERARRELVRLVGTEVMTPPPSGRGAKAWIGRVREAIEETLAERRRAEGRESG